MLERRLRITVPLVPVRGPAVQDAEQLRLAFGQFPSEQVAEQVVIAVPHTLLIKRHQKEVRPFDLLQLARRSLVVEHGVAQGAAHSFEHRRPPEKAECTGT